VHDERAGSGSAFDGVDTGYRFGVESVGAETVNRFGGEGDETAGAQELGGALDFAGIGGLRSGWGHK